MSEIVRVIGSTEEISALATELRETVSATEITTSAVLDGFDAWAAALGERETADIPGVQFLRMWLRRGTLEPIIARELGGNALCGGCWTEDGRARLKAWPLGIVGHWPAGNIEIQPILSMTCALLGGNASFVRVPGGLDELTRLIMGKLEQIDSAGVLTQRVRMLIFDHTRKDLQEVMARSVDGAMIWGGEEAVLSVRGLPFPHWARLAIFGPRISVAAMDADSWSTEGQESWCRRIARDVWQFDQQACSSPQVLFLEKKAGHSSREFVQSLKRAFESENQLHPRQTIHAALTTVICQARASWLLDNAANSAIFPQGPEWTILLGSGSEIPKPTQGKTLTVREVDDLLDPIEKLDGNVQTLGLAMADPVRETKLASLAARRGVDRIVKLGRMHVFAPPWDGVDLIRPMVRIVRHVPSVE